MAFDKEYWVSLLRSDAAAMFNQRRTEHRAGDIQTRISLMGADLTKLYARGLDLRLANLNQADLSGSDFAGGDFRRASLRYAVLKGSNLANALFQGADMRHAVLEGAMLKGANFENALFSTQAQVDYVRAQGAVVSAEPSVEEAAPKVETPPPAPVRVVTPTPAPTPTLAHAPSAQRTREEWFDLLKQSTKKFQTEMVAFKKVYPQTRLDLLAADFYGASIPNIMLNAANLMRGNFRYANVAEGNFRSAQMVQADFIGCNAAGVDFSYAALRELKGRHANFCHANFESAKLDRADLTGADLREAILKDASLKGTILTGVIFSSLQQVAYAKAQGAVVDDAPIIDASLGKGHGKPANRVRGAGMEAKELPQDLLKGFPPIIKHFERSDAIALNHAIESSPCYELNFYESGTLAALLTSHNLRPLVQHAIARVLVDNQMLDSEVAMGVLELSSVATSTVSQTMAEAVSMDFIPHRDQGYLTEIYIDRSKWSAGLAAMKKAYPQLDRKVIEQVQGAVFEVLSNVNQRTKTYTYFPGDRLRTDSAEQFIYQFQHRAPLHDTKHYPTQQDGDVIGFRLGSQMGKHGFPDIRTVARAVINYSKEVSPQALDFSEYLKEKSIAPETSSWWKKLFNADVNTTSPKTR